jgi:hypothetical protein
VPFDGLNEGVCVTARSREGIGEHEGADRVSSVIRTVRIEFSSGVIGLKVDEGLVDIASYCVVLH